MSEYVEIVRCNQCLGVGTVGPDDNAPMLCPRCRGTGSVTKGTANPKLTESVVESVDRDTGQITMGEQSVG